MKISHKGFFLITWLPIVVSLNYFILLMVVISNYDISGLLVFWAICIFVTVLSWFFIKEIEKEDKGEVIKNVK